MASEVTQNSTMEADKSDAETEFVKVKRRNARKRKLNEDSANDMDTAEKSHSDVKRPSFPPISADKMVVGFHLSRLSCPRNLSFHILIVCCLADNLPFQWCR